MGDIHTAMARFGWDYEVIVVNDGSRDGTGAVLEELSWLDARLRVVTHSRNRGYGAALKSGFAAASKEWVFFMDADRQFDIREITTLAEKSDAYDYVAGYRVHRRDHWMRLVNAWLFHTAIRALFGLGMRDIDCAFKLIRREVITRANLESEGAFINAELALRAKQFGYRVIQVPVSHYPRRYGNPTGANPRVILRAMREIIWFRLKNSS